MNRNVLYLAMGGVLLSVAMLVVMLSRLQTVGLVRFDGLRLVGNARFRNAVSNALVLLRTRAPDAYEIVTNNVGVIAESDHSGMMAYAQPPVFHLNDRTAFYSVTWCAASIAHDSLHSKQFHDYMRNHDGRVPDLVWTGERAEKECGAYQLKVLKAIKAPAYEIEYCASVTNRYWEVDYRKRDW